MTPHPQQIRPFLFKDINVKAKTAVKNNTVKVKNIAAVLKKKLQRQKRTGWQDKRPVC